MNLHKVSRLAKASIVTLAMVLGLSSCTLDYVVGYVYMTTNKANPGVINQYSIAFQTGALTALPGLGEPAHSIFGGMAVSDAFGSVISMTIAGGLILATLTAASYLHRQHVERGEFYALCLFAAAGMSLLGISSDLIMIFVSLIGWSNRRGSHEFGSRASRAGRRAGLGRAARGAAVRGA